MHLHTLQDQMNPKKTATYNKDRKKNTDELMEETSTRTTPYQHETNSSKDTRWGIPWITVYE